jgi:hypothetical protein
MPFVEFIYLMLLISKWTLNRGVSLGGSILKSPWAQTTRIPNQPNRTLALQ